MRWVDKRATWFKGFPLRADILVFVEDLVARKTAARSLRLRGLALLLHFESPFLQRTRTLDTAQEAPELFEHLGYRSLGQPLWLMVSVVLQSAVGSTGSPHIRGSEGPRPLPLYVEHFTHGRPSRYS